jgi:hypothetical protein
LGAAAAEEEEEGRISPNMFDIIHRPGQLIMHPRSATRFARSIIILLHAMPIS